MNRNLLFNFDRWIRLWGNVNLSVQRAPFIMDIVLKAILWTGVISDSSKSVQVQMGKKEKRKARDEKREESIQRQEFSCNNIFTQTLIENNCINYSLHEL